MSDQQNSEFHFQRDVLDASHQRPVLVDFWASWCGPCRMLGPILDQLAADRNDWTLVKVDTEAHPDIAQQYRIQSIPHVKLFVQGEVVGEFSGALPRTAIEQWLNDHLPNPAREALQHAVDRLGPWPVSAEQDLTDLEELAERAEPSSPEPLLTFAKYLLPHAPSRARQLVEAILIGHPGGEEAEAIRHLANFLEAPLPQVGEIPELGHHLQAGSFEPAIKSLTDALMGQAEQLDGPVIRQVALAMFRLRGEDDPLTRKYRRWFAMALH